MQKHGLMTPDADGRMESVQFAVPEQVLRGTPNESGFIYRTSEDGKTMLGVWECGAYAETQLARTDVSLQRGMMDGIWPIAYCLTDHPPICRYRRSSGHRLNTVQARP